MTDATDDAREAALARDIRAEIVRVMHATLSDRHGRWDYEAVRPESPSGKRGQYVQGQYVKTDCSKGAQNICFWTPGCPDPMKQNYGPFGNSGTMTAVLPRVSVASQLKPGDFVLFGVDGEDHATVVLQAGPDPLLWSFGHPESRPNTYRLSGDRRERHFRRNPLPDYKPTPDDKLREQTGYWAWLQWALGEGDWSHKGKANKAVRPNVRRPVPLSFWKRRAAYIARRKRANSLERAMARAG